jgi:hypothetical protein
MKAMVPAANLMADQLHEPLSDFFNKSRFDLDPESLSRSPMVSANKTDEAMKDAAEKEEVGSNTNSRDWLKLGLNSSHEIRKPDPIELELFTEKLSCQAEKQMIGSFKRQRHGISRPLVRSSWSTVRGGDFMVISPPLRPEAGVWLFLYAARNQ